MPGEEELYIAWTKGVTSSFLFYTSLILTPVGLIFNTLQIVVFARKKFNNCNTRFYFMVSALLCVHNLGESGSESFLFSTQDFGNFSQPCLDHDLYLVLWRRFWTRHRNKLDRVLQNNQLLCPHLCCDTVMVGSSDYLRPAGFCPADQVFRIFA